MLSGVVDEDKKPVVETPEERFEEKLIQTLINQKSDDEQSKDEAEDQETVREQIPIIENTFEMLMNDFLKIVIQ